MQRFFGLGPIFHHLLPLPSGLGSTTGCFGNRVKCQGKLQNINIGVGTWKAWGMNTPMFVESGMRSFSLRCLGSLAAAGNMLQIVYVIETLLAYLKDILAKVKKVTIKQHLNFD